MQKQLIFFTKEYPPSTEAKLAICNPESEHSPLNRFIGNKSAVRRLGRVGFTALGNHNHVCPFNFSLIGPASSGKTTLAKLFAEVLGLPFVEIDPSSIQEINDILKKIGDVLSNIKNDWGQSLELVNFEEKVFLPPVVVFIDEVHLLNKEIIHGLLKATEPKDRMMQTENGWIVDTSNVTWIIATTERGLLFDAFDTRFMKINLGLYTRKEIAVIIKKNFPNIPTEVCDGLAYYGGKIPREALSFSKEVELEFNMNGGDWVSATATVAKDNQIDSYGLSKQRLDVIKALANGPISKNRMATIISCKEEELVRFIMPVLLISTEDSEPMVTISSKGYKITETGIQQLEKRKIKHKGREFLLKE